MSAFRPQRCSRSNTIGEVARIENMPTPPARHPALCESWLIRPVPLFGSRHEALVYWQPRRHRPWKVDGRTSRIIGFLESALAIVLNAVRTNPSGRGQALVLVLVHPA